MKQLVRTLGCALALAAAPAFAEDTSAPVGSPLGRWISSTGNLEVEVAPCGEALCGTVVKVLANRSMSRDGEEMKPADSRDPLGMRVLTDFVPSEFEERGGAREPVEWRGTIYNRENARTYRCIMTLGSRGELLLHGYVGLPWFGRTAAWTRPGVAVGGTR